MAVRDEPSWVREARPRMNAAYERGGQACVAPSLLADAIDHYEQWRDMAHRLREQVTRMKGMGGYVVVPDDGGWTAWRVDDDGSLPQHAGHAAGALARVLAHEAQDADEVPQ